jgi:hypothetical protein
MNTRLCAAVDWRISFTQHFGPERRNVVDEYPGRHRPRALRLRGLIREGELIDVDERQGSEPMLVIIGKCTTSRSQIGR